MEQDSQVAETVSNLPQTVVNPQNRISVETRSNLFQPGNNANPGGRPKTKLFRHKFMKHLRSMDGEVDRADRVVANMIDHAAGQFKDSVAAFVAIRDTVDGKPESSDFAAGAPVVVNIGIAAGRPAVEFDEE